MAVAMAEDYLAKRRRFLLQSQNIDGGWGYFPGKSSWLEPTAYAMLALHGAEGAADSLDRAWRRVESWRLPDGSWRAGAQVQDRTWVTALAVTLHTVFGRSSSALEQSTGWLLNLQGAERCLTFRLMEFFGLGHVEGDTSHPAWPWRPGTSSWIEPTVHTIVALKKASGLVSDSRLTYRIHEGEEMILARRCADGGWNHGAATTFHIAAPSYPESTGLALLGLQDRADRIGRALDTARTFHSSTDSPLARAWLGIALQAWGDRLSRPDDSTALRRDVMLAALEALAHPDGNHRLFRTTEQT